MFQADLTPLQGAFEVRCRLVPVVVMSRIKFLRHKYEICLDFKVMVLPESFISGFARDNGLNGTETRAAVL
jgi:hypothetical protein